MKRQLEIYLKHYGPEVGPRLYRAQQSQAAHAGVSARLRRKIEAIRVGEAAGPRARAEHYPLFDEALSLG